MAVTTFSSRQFNQDLARAKKAASLGPVFVTDRGKPAHVLLSIDDYRKLSAQQASIIDLLAMPGAAEIDFEPERMGVLSQEVDLS
jgi:prevent-host-death family protein